MKNPIVLFTYDRPDHTRRTVEALQRNFGASAHDLIVYSDAPRTPNKVQAVAAVRQYVQRISGFRSVTIHFRPLNYGLAGSIIDGVTEVLTKFERIIVLEDDLVTSQYFLSYMNEALNLFADDDRVISINGYTYPVKDRLPEVFFLNDPGCWGWATWRRGWALFEPDGKKLLEEIKKRKLSNKFDYNGTFSYTKMLKDQVAGANDSWAIRWYASAFLADKLTLYPGKSLVHNIGNDSSGTHCRTTSALDVEPAENPVAHVGVEVIVSQMAREAIEKFMLDQQPLYKRVLLRFMRRGFL